MRLDRAKDGNLGDHKALGGGLLEMRLTHGAGIRIYFGQEGRHLVVLLVGGDKKSQRRDIEKARIYWADYLLRGGK